MKKKIKIKISRTFQSQQFEPVKIEAEVAVGSNKNFESVFRELFDDIMEQLIEAEVELRDIYCPKPE